MVRFRYQRPFLALLCFSLLTLALSMPLQPVSASDEYDGLRGKWRSYLIGGSYSVSDPDVSAQLAAITAKAQSHWDAMDTSASRAYLWSDLNDAAASNLDKSSFMALSYSRLESMALAFATSGSGLYQDTALLSDIVSALDWMYANKYNSSKSIIGNWFDWEINVPLSLNNSVVLLYDELTSSQRSNYMNAINHFSPSPATTSAGSATGANRVWKATVVGIRGIIVKDSAKISSARDALNQVFANVTSGDGFYDDGSFLQHLAHPYNGGYGKSLLATIVPFMYVLSGSTWSVTSPLSHNVYGWIYDAFEPLIYRGAMMDMTRGREISRRISQDHTQGLDVIKSVLQLAEFAPAEHAAAYKSMAKYWIETNTFMNFFEHASIYHIALAKSIVNNSAIASRGELVKNKLYPNMDRAVHLRPGFGFGLSMSSNRVYTYESINNENLKGWYTGDGMTYLYNNDLNHYSDEYWGLVNPYRLPGTTVDTRTRGNSSNQSARTGEDWVGGANVNDDYGVAGMLLNAAGSTLAAKKSWFMFDDEIVALGAGISSTDGRTIETIIENRKINNAGTNALTINGSVKSTSLSWSETMSGVNWMHLAGSSAGADIGYYFPSGTTVKGLRQARTGSWSQINTYAKTTDTTVLTRNFVTLWQDHGINPSNASYAYALLPGRTSSGVSGYAGNPDFTILANSSDVQAVKETTINAVGANFWNDAIRTVNVDGSPYLTSNKKASVITVESGDRLDMGVSDPTQINGGTIELELNRSATEVITADPQVTVTQLSPTVKLTVNVQGMKGKTLSVSLNLGAPIAPDYQLTAAADAYVRDGSYANTNYGTAPTLITKTNTIGVNRESYLRFDLSPVSGDVTNAKIRLVPVAVGAGNEPNAVYLVNSNAWGETSITWNNKPSSGTLLGTWASMTPGTPVEVNVTSQVKAALAGDGMLSIRVFSPVDGGPNGDVGYGARENPTTTYRPVILIYQ